MAYVIFDTETTGLHPEHGDRIIEIAALRVMNGVVTNDVFNSFINPHRLIPTDAKKIHGIANEQLEKAPEAAEVIPKFLQFIGSDILVAHNASFDMAFLKEEMKRLGLDSEKIPIHRCTLIQVQKEMPELKSHTLAAMTEHFGISVDRRHRALDDVKALAQVFLKIHQEEPTLF